LFVYQTPVNFENNVVLVHEDNISIETTQLFKIM
jgi:hypothetical protein